MAKVKIIVVFECELKGCTPEEQRAQIERAMRDINDGSLTVTGDSCVSVASVKLERSGVHTGSGEV